MTANAKIGRQGAQLALLLVVILLIALPLRLSGLFRGLDAGDFFHPDEPKQVAALHNYLEGRYLWYVDSPFYDGYPYGLNHVDEWILRPLFRARHLLRSYLELERPPTASSRTPPLFRWARGLRVLYSLLCLTIAFLAARRLRLGTVPSILAVLLLSLSPIPIAVSHFATGDIGADLFSGLALLMLCFHVRSGRRHLLFWASLAAGLAFACKYNGVLVLTAFFLLFLFQLLSGGRVKDFLLSLALTAAGTTVGAVVLTPHILISPKKTWGDLWANLFFIKDYNVPPEFIERPLAEQLVHQFSANSPGIVQNIGTAVTLLALAGAAAAFLRFLRCRRGDACNDTERRETGLRLAVFLYPFAALLVSLSLKPSVQPFHFSFLQIPLVLGAVSAITVFWQSPRPAGKALSALMVLVTVFELGIMAERDTFFWLREDTMGRHRTMAGTLFWDGEGPPGEIRDISLESPGSAAVFRNRHRKVVAEDGAFWRDIHAVPVPSTPYPAPGDWIFLNGPAFPRNDRMFPAPAGLGTEKHLVMQSHPGEIRVGIRSGSRPSEVTLVLGGDERSLKMKPNTQVVLPLSPAEWRESAAAAPDGGSLFLVPFRIRPLTGDVWVSVFASRREEALYRLFGASPDTARPEAAEDLWPFPREELLSKLEGLRFLEGEEAVPLLLDAGAGGESVTYLPPEFTPLPRGPYLLECEVSGLSEANEIELSLSDTSGAVIFADQVRRFGLSRGVHRLRFRFHKTFAPLESRLMLDCLKGRCALLRWRLAPDASRIASDLEAWTEGGRLPPWMEGYPTAADNAEGGYREVNVSFGGKFVIGHVSLPPALPAGSTFLLHSGAEMLDFPEGRLEDYHLFLHFKDSAGKLAFSTGTPLLKALANSDRQLSFEKVTLPPDLAEGAYELRLGAWNARTRRKLAPSGTRGEKVGVGTISVTSP